MGVGTLAFSVLAFAAPVAVVSGFIPFVIYYQGIGAPGAFLIAMALLLLFSVGYTTMTRYLPSPGAFYSYITAGLGKPIGLGSSFVAMGGYALLAIGTYQFLGISTQSLVETTFGGPTLPWYVYALAAAAIVSVLGYFRIDLSAKILTFAMAAEVAIILVFDAAVFIDGGPQGRSMTPFSLDSMTSGSVGIAVLFAATCFLGFESTAIYRDEVKDPKKTVPRATYLAVVFIGILYIVTAWLVVVAFGVGEAVDAASTDPVGMFGAATNSFVGTWAYDVVSVLLVTSLFAAVLAIQNVISRYGHSLGVDKVLPSALGKVHSKHGSPHISSVVVSAVIIVSLLLFVLGGSDPAISYARLAGTGGYCLLVLMFLTSVAVVMFFGKRRDIADASVWHTFVAPALSTVGLFGVLYLAVTNFDVLTGGSASASLWLQFIIWTTFAVGIVVALIYRRARPSTYERIGRQTVG